MLKHLLRGGGSSINGDPWVATLGGSSYDYSYSVAVAPDGSVYVCGDTQSVGDGNNVCLLAKYSSSGTVQWQKTLGGSNGDYGRRSVAVASDGSVYVSGSTRSAGAGSFDLLLAKYSSSGTVQWQKTLGGSRDDYGPSVAVAPDGSVYVCGHTYSASVGECDFLLVKFSSSGTVQWQKILGGGKGDYGESVAVAPDGSVYICGFTYSAGAGEYDFFLAKYSSSGTVQWYKTLGGSSDDEGYSVAVAPDGSVYVCGIARSARDAGGSNFLLAKFSSSGTVQWQKSLGDSSHSTYGRSVAVAPDGSIYACGYTYLGSAGRDEALLAKFSSSGTVQWQKTLGGSGNDDVYSVAVAPDGSVYVCGNTQSAGAGLNDFLLARITDSIIEKDTITLGIFTFQDTHLTVNNISLTITSPGFSASNANLSLRNSPLTVGTPSLTTNLYTL